MIAIVENTFKHIFRSSRRGLFTINNISHYSTKKGQEGKDNDQTSNNQENQKDKNIETQQEQKHGDKARLLDKFNLLNKKIQGLKTQIESHKDYDEIKAGYKKLNSDLASGRDKITTMIAQGEKNWQNTKQKISKIEDQQISQFGIELIKFNDNLKELTSVHEKKQEDTLGEGIAMTSRILLNSLQKFNFKPYEPIKEKYDSKKHINAQQKQVKKDALVAQVIEPGWIYKNTVVKPAVVKIN